ncbi:hypothetical protein [Campylobacter canadensis]|uniref:hypothetical protein n=1 Tax=Campylobacter canadensis TaxID=449520 RepID=UPI0015539904|nr:hypothetical protein [Campylobacter canadensis]
MSKKVEFLIIVFAFVIFFTQAFFILETKKNNDINLSFLNLVKASNSNDFNGLDFCILELNCTYKLPKEFIFIKMVIGFIINLRKIIKIILFQASVSALKIYFLLFYFLLFCFLYFFLYFICFIKIILKI